MASSSPSFQLNFAQLGGFRSLAAAIVFAVLYAVLSGWFIVSFARHQTRVTATLGIFSLARFAAFVIRAVMIEGKGATNLSMFIAVQVLFNVGFFALIGGTSEAIVVEMSKHSPEHRLPLEKAILQRQRFVRLALIAATALSIAATVKTSQGNLGPSTLSTVSAIIFVVVTGWVTLSAVVNLHNAETKGQKKMAIVLLVISLLLVARELFLAITVKNTRRRTNEAFWYPFSEVTCFLAVSGFVVVGIFKARAKKIKKEKGYDGSEVDQNQ
ncbi:hypothetical protein DL96DRAFT_1563977 [Flagelloscypha sp. PMI_526]|nr:hypothetical protein DL96DRAFT_1563977 [Flagelloscypha sp. PMI_526]